jgi:hypothetical protein
VPGLRPPEVAPAIEAPAPAEPAPVDVRSAAAAARRRIALFALVLLVAGSAAWGAGRLLSRTLEPAPAQPVMDHRMGPGMHEMPGMTMPGTSG